MQEVVILQVTVPVVQRRAADRHPHEGAHKVHNRVGQLAGKMKWGNCNYMHRSDLITKRLVGLPLVLGRAKTERNQLHGRVDEEADKHAGSDDLHVRVLLLVQVPGAARTKEIARIAGPVQDDDNQVNHLDACVQNEIENKKLSEISRKRARKQSHTNLPGVIYVVT